jgi:hypothetical protein
MKKLTTLWAVLGTALLCACFAPSAGWLTIHRDRLGVTEGAIENPAGDGLSVNVPKTRAYVVEWTAPSAELRFTYLGGTQNESALGSGTIRRQFGLKLRAQIPATWCRRYGALSPSRN